MNWKGDRAHRKGGALGQRNTMFAASSRDAVALWEGRSPADASTGVHAARKSVELPRELCCLVSTANFHHILDPEHRSACWQEIHQIFSTSFRALISHIDCRMGWRASLPHLTSAIQRKFLIHRAVQDESFLSASRNTQINLSISLMHMRQPLHECCR